MGKDDQPGLFLAYFIIALIVCVPLVISQKLIVAERKPKEITARIDAIESLPLGIRKVVLIKWHEPQEIYPDSGLLGFFKDSPSKGWLAYPGKTQMPMDVKSEKVWMKYVIKNRDLPIVEILEIRILKE